jgi:predicted CxxxxCH...CXXCH cytochrome family protein
LHLDGRVELGNGNGTCGACHGTGSSPWPITAAHPSHENPTISVPVACTSCHVVPASIFSPGHLNGVVDVQFSGLATARGSDPTWNGNSCTGVACHGANLPETPAVVPIWTDASGAAAKCGACHGIPPQVGHTPSTDCGRSDCHGSEVGETTAGLPSITTAGLALHIDGIIEVNR